MVKINIPYPVLFIVNKLENAGHEAFLIGGAVRDLLIGKENIKDWDITTNATPEQMLELFEESFYDNAFGTVMVAPKHVVAQIVKESGNDDLDTSEFVYDGMDVFDITTYRSEAGYSDRRRPDNVSWGKSLEEDVKRRDFTINAIALRIENSEFSPKTSQGIKIQNYIEVDAEIFDYYGGEKDLEAKIIRTVGNASERFQEDALRMMRAIRFGAQLSFTLENETLEAIRVNSELIRDVSWERIRDELMKIMASDYPADGILLMHSSGLLAYVLPELLESIDVPQGGHHIYDVWNHAIESLRECPARDPIVRLATLLHDVGKPRTMRRQGPRGVTFYGHEVVGARMVSRIADRLRFSNKDKEKMVTLVRWHMFAYDSQMTDAAIRRFIKRVGLVNINDMMMLRIGDRKGGGSKATSWRLRELQERIGENLYEPMSVKDLKIDGRDLMEFLNITPGPIVGMILNQLFDEVMDGSLENDLVTLQNRAKTIYETK